MTKKRSTKSALLMSALSLFLCFSMLLGTTFAWFTDSVTSANNIIKSGNLDIELKYAKIDGGNLTGWDTVQGKDNIFDKNALWEPGRVEVVYLEVSNLGSLALKYQLGVNVVKETPGTNVDGEELNLSEHLVFKVVDLKDKPTTAYTSEEAVAAAGSVKGLKDYNGTTTALEVGGIDYVALIVYMPETVGNEANYRGNAVPTIELGINLFATQQAAENDSFGNDYDEGANHPKFKVTTANDLQNAVNEATAGDVIELVDDIVLTEPLVIPAAQATFSMRSAPAPVVIDLNGKTLSGKMHKSEGAIIKNEGSLVLKNGTVSSLGNNGGSALANSGTAVLENVTLNGAPNADGSWPAYTVNNTGVLTATNAKFTSFHGAVASYNEGAVVTLNNCEIDMAGIPGFTNHGIYTYSSGAVVINGGTYVNRAADQNSTGGSVINGAVTVNSGTFSGRIENYYGTPVINGGTFSVKPNAKFVTGGYKAESVDGKWVVSAAIKTNEDLQAAINNAKNGETIIFVQDITSADGVLISDKNITIDLGGHTYTVSEGASTNNRNIKIIGSSTVTVKNGTLIAAGNSASGAYGTIRTEGTANVTLDNLKLYSYRGNGLNVKAVTGTTVTINNCEIYSQYGGGVEASGGTIVLNNTKIEQKGVYSNGWYSVAMNINGGGKIVVNSGEYFGSAIDTDANAAKGNSVAFILSSGGTLDIYGGTFNGIVAEKAEATNFCGLIYADRAAVVNIYGGTFNSNGAILDMRNNEGTQPNPSATISGGNFSADPRVSGLYASNLITVANGYSVVENADGIWTVVAE